MVMSGFWNSFSVLETTTVDEMGEPIVIAGEPSVGVVQPVEKTPGASSGGLRVGMDFNVLVALDVVAEDGHSITARGITGAIYSVEPISNTAKILHCGPQNRWDGV